MHIRPFHEADLSSIFTIYEESKLDELRFEEGNFQLLPLRQDETRWLKFKQSDVYVYDKSRVVAYCAFSENHIETIYVSREFRRMGIARELLEFMLLKLSGDVSLHVAKNNFPAKKLYEDYGFKVEKEFITSYNGELASAHRMVLMRHD